MQVANIATHRSLLCENVVVRFGPGCQATPGDALLRRTPVRDVAVRVEMGVAIGNLHPFTVLPRQPPIVYSAIFFSDFLFDPVNY